MIEDAELIPQGRTQLGESNLRDWHGEPTVLDYGMIIICRQGRATLRVNFTEWVMTKGAVITLFPNDVVVLSQVSDDFRVEHLRYNASLLREASLQLEQTVYSQLRKDRCRSASPIVTKIIDAMFTLLNIYFEQRDCICLDQLVLCQLKSFFLGFHDYLYRHPSERPQESCSPRVRELFNQFMLTLERRYRDSRDVSYYASLLHITPKYLNTIAQKVTGHNAKTLIDHYAVLQIKLSLRTTTASAKEIAWQYHFSDLSFFCRYFKQHTGMSPMQFREGLKR